MSDLDRNLILLLFLLTNISTGIYTALVLRELYQVRNDLLNLRKDKP